MRQGRHIKNGNCPTREEPGLFDFDCPRCKADYLVNPDGPIVIKWEEKCEAYVVYDCPNETYLHHSGAFYALSKQARMGSHDYTNASWKTYREARSAYDRWAKANGRTADAA